MKVLSWDGTGVVLWHKRLDAGTFHLPRLTDPTCTSVRISEAEFDAFFAGLATNLTH